MNKLRDQVIKRHLQKMEETLRPQIKYEELAFQKSQLQIQLKKMLS